MEKRTETLEIEGMSCMHCVRAVREALEETEGVEVEDVQIGTARVRYDPGQVGHDRLVAAVEEAGYSVHGPAETP